MLRIATKTKLGPDDVINKAVEFFGPNGYKLDLKEQSTGCAYFEGGGGGVEVTTCVEDDGTSVEFTSSQWDFQVKEFIGKIR